MVASVVTNAGTYDPGRRTDCGGQPSAYEFVSMVEVCVVLVLALV